MIRNISIFSFVISLIGLATSVGLLTISNNRLNIELKGRDSLIKNIRIQDSGYALQIKQYSDTLTQYVRGCSFEINGKVISTAELLKVANKSFQDNAYLRDSVRYFSELTSFYKNALERDKALYNQVSDSLFVYRQILIRVEKDYGIQYNFDHSNKGYRFYRSEMNKVDSALLLFPYFKDRLVKDSASKDKWIIRGK